MMTFDVAVIGAGPAGLAGALALCRARKRVVLFDAWPPRNAAASEVRGYVTQDGTPPAELRRIALDQLAAYEGFQFRDEVRVMAIRRSGARFDVEAGPHSVSVRRVLLAVGLIDQLPDLPGYRELWGTSLFQCPYCHAWELSGRAFGYLAPDTGCADWAMLLRAWTKDLVIFTDAAFAIDRALRDELGLAKIRLEERRVVALRAERGRLAAVCFAGGAEIPRDVLFVRPRQRQTPLVQGLVEALGLRLAACDLVATDDYQTSVPGIYAAGDLMTHDHGALVAAAEGSRAAHALDPELTRELVLEGML
jgi:thioredoxin reductase